MLRIESTKFFDELKGNAYVILEWFKIIRIWIVWFMNQFMRMVVESWFYVLRMDEVGACWFYVKRHGSFWNLS